MQLKEKLETLLTWINLSPEERTSKRLLFAYDHFNDKWHETSINEIIMPEFKIENKRSEHKIVIVYNTVNKEYHSHIVKDNYKLEKNEVLVKIIPTLL